MTHLIKMLEHAQARVEALDKQGVYPAKGVKRREAMGAEALSFVIGYEAALMDAGLIANHSPQAFLIAVRGYEQVASSLAALRERHAEEA